MIQDALLAYLYYTAIILMFSFLAVDAVLLRQAIDAATIRLLARIDMFYGLSAILVLATGLARLFWGAKGASFYSGNPVFHAKLGLFVLVGLLSIAPTIKFIRWSRTLKQQPDFTVVDGERRNTRRLVMVEIHLAALLPLLAVFMARGFGIK